MLDRKQKEQPCIHCVIYGAYKRDLTGDVRPSSNPARKGRVLLGRELRREVVQPSASPVIPHSLVPSDRVANVDRFTHGIEEVNSAMEAAMHITKIQGIPHPQTIPT